MNTRHVVSGILVLTAIVSGGCADTLSIHTQAFRLQTTEPIRRVAVVDFAGETGQAAADMLTMHLQRAGFEVVERQYLKDLLGEIEATKEGRTDATVVERVSKMGRLINADAVITGDLVKLNPPVFERKSKTRLAYEAATCELSVRAFDVRTREVFWTTWIDVAATAKTGEQLGVLDYLNEACAEVAESFVNKTYTDGHRLYRGTDITKLRLARTGARK